MIFHTNFSPDSIFRRKSLSETRGSSASGCFTTFQTPWVLRVFPGSTKRGIISKVSGLIAHVYIRQAADISYWICGALGHFPNAILSPSYSRTFQAAPVRVIEIPSSNPSR
jgi:hypothetical protein